MESEKKKIKTHDVAEKAQKRLENFITQTDDTHQMQDMSRSPFLVGCN
jgi:hypothetical protein